MPTNDCTCALAAIDHTNFSEVVAFREKLRQGDFETVVVNHANNAVPLLNVEHVVACIALLNYDFIRREHDDFQFVNQQPNHWID